LETSTVASRYNLVVSGFDLTMEEVGEDVVPNSDLFSALMKETNKKKIITVLKIDRYLEIGRSLEGLIATILKM
jgi:hypothetical protein